MRRLIIPVLVAHVVQLATSQLYPGIERPGIEVADIEEGEVADIGDPTQYDPNGFFDTWAENPNPVSYLSEDQATFWYSLGRYQPRRYQQGYGYEEAEYTYPRPDYDEYPQRPQYRYPPYPSNGGGNSSCCCSEIPGPMRTRREYREMTPQMRLNFVRAVMALANYHPGGGGWSAYSLFVILHQVWQGPCAHGGAAFLPWHREYLWRFETALIVYGGYPENQGLPYWDNTLDSGLPNPADSALFTPQYMGNNNGVLGAPFAGLVVPWFCSGQVERYSFNGAGFLLFNENDLERLMQLTCFAHLYQTPVFNCWGFPCNLESRHAGPHIWFGSGSDMSGYCSPSDPIFWLHHGFIDCAWEEFRHKAQKTHLEKEYPQTNYGHNSCRWDRPMNPFQEIINAHGLSTHYTTYYYRCAERPSAGRCCADDHCNPLGDSNSALWCNNGKCQAKVREGGNCGYTYPHRACWCWTGTPQCYRNPIWSAGVCRCN